MKRKLILLALIVLALPLMAAGEKPTWYNTERDVWIDHKLERPVTIYRESGTARILLLSKSFRHGVVLDPSSGSVASIDREKILFDVDLGEIRLDAAPRGTRGTVTRTGDGIVMATVGRRDIVIGSHQSPSGNLEVEELLRDYPVWDAKMGAYEPDESTVAELRAVKEPTTIDVVFATWCGDSRREVPRFLKTVAAAANENLKVRLIGIDADFHEPLEMIHEEKITNVPTFIVRRERREIGRIVETTATESIEADLLAIVSGDELAHPGRWERETRTSHGVYELTLTDGNRGTETWEMFDTRTGGRLMHSVIRTARLEREIWHRLDAQGRTEFIEITDETGDEVQRSRIRVGDDHVRVTSRGSRSGIIDQVLKVPENCVFATGSVLTEGMTCDPFLGSEVVEVVRYSVPLEDCAGIGCLETVQLVRGESSLDGEQRLDRIEVATASDRRTIWIDRERSIPVKLEAAWGVARLAP